MNEKRADPQAGLKWDARRRATRLAWMVGFHGNRLLGKIAAAGKPAAFLISADEVTRVTRANYKGIGRGDVTIQHGRSRHPLT